MEKKMKIGQKIYIPHLNERTLETYISQHYIVGLNNKNHMELEPPFSNVCQFGALFNPNYLFENIEDAREKCIEILKNKKEKLMEMVHTLEENIDAVYDNKLEANNNIKKDMKYKLKKPATIMKYIKNTFPDDYNIGNILYLTIVEPTSFHKEHHSIYVKEFTIDGIEVSFDKNEEINYLFKLFDKENNCLTNLYLDKDFKIDEKKLSQSNIIYISQNSDIEKRVEDEVNKILQKEHHNQIVRKF